MASLRYEYMLEGATKFSPWRERMVLLLEEKGLWEIAKGKVVLPADLAQQPDFLKKDVKARRIIVDGVKDHIIPHLSGKETAKDRCSYIQREWPWMQQ
jgi:hypothetical protein